MWIGEMPEHWQIKRLKFLADLQTGLTLGKDFAGRKLVRRPYLRVANVQDGYLDLDTITEIDLPVDEVDRYELRPGDVLITEGGDFDKLGRGYVWEGQISGCLHQNHVFAVRPQADQLDSRFLAGLMASAHGKAYFTSTSQQTTNLATTSSTKLKNFPLLLPPLTEQRAITTFLDRETARIDALIGHKERLIALLEEKRQAVISHAVVRGLDPEVPIKDSGVPWLGMVPRHWRVLPVKRTWRQCDYGLSESLADVGEVRVLTMGNIQSGDVTIPEEGSWDHVPSQMLLEDKDLVYNRTNSLIHVGKVGLFRAVPGVRVSFASYLVRIRFNDSADPVFMNYFLNSDGFLRTAQSTALPSINQANLNPTRYGSLTICLPPIEEQREIVTVLGQYSDRNKAILVSIEEGIARLREYRTALISAAVTGQIDVRDEVTP
jgi:type I restriction enzyme S subunit